VGTMPSITVVHTSETAVALSLYSALSCSYSCYRDGAKCGSSGQDRYFCPRQLFGVAGRRRLYTVPPRGRQRVVAEQSTLRNRSQRSGSISSWGSTSATKRSFRLWVYCVHRSFSLASEAYITVHQSALLEKHLFLFITLTSQQEHWQTNSNSTGAYVLIQFR